MISFPTGQIQISKSTYDASTDKAVLKYFEEIHLQHVKGVGENVTCYRTNMKDFEPFYPVLEKQEQLIERERQGYEARRKQLKEMQEGVKLFVLDDEEDY